jgi:hypothetical protein
VRAKRCALSKRALRARAVGCERMHLDRHRHLVAMHHVPRVGAQLVLDLVGEARPAPQHETADPAKAECEQVVEAGEVVHVGVTDERVADAQQQARRQVLDVTEVEQQRAAFVAHVDDEARLQAGRVDKARVERGSHGARREAVEVRVTGQAPRPSSRPASCPVGTTRRNNRA